MDKVVTIIIALTGVIAMFYALGKMQKKAAVTTEDKGQKYRYKLEVARNNGADPVQVELYSDVRHSSFDDMLHHCPDVTRDKKGIRIRSSDKDPESGKTHKIIREIPVGAITEISFQIWEH